MESYAVSSKAEEEWARDWPEELLLSIFLRVPFPDALKVATLSRRWRILFASFVCEKWSQYCPILLRNCSDNVNLPSKTSTSSELPSSTLVAFSRITKQWEVVPLMRCLGGAHLHVTFMRIFGPIMVQVYSYIPRRTRMSKRSAEIDSDGRVRVANIFTGEFVRLPVVGGMDVKLLLHWGGKLGTYADVFVSRGFFVYKLVDVVFSCNSEEFRVILIYSMRTEWFIPDREKGLLLFEFRSSTGVWEERGTFVDEDSALDTQCAAVKGSYLIRHNHTWLTFQGV